MVRPISSASAGEAPALGHHLAAEQVHALDRVRALVKRIELLVAHVRLGKILARVAVAAVDLDSEALASKPRSAGNVLATGVSKSSSSPARSSLFVRGAVLRDVRVAGDRPEQSEASFDDRLLPQQHPPNVGVLDDRHLLAAARAELRPCLRSSAYARDSWYAADAVAAPFTPTMMRASFIIWNM